MRNISLSIRWGPFLNPISLKVLLAKGQPNWNLKFLIPELKVESTSLHPDIHPVYDLCFGYIFRCVPLPL